MRIRYHHPIPNFYKIENPLNPLNTVSDDFLDELNDFVLNHGFVGISYSKLSDEFKKEWGIDWDNILILKYAMSEDILKMDDSKEKTILEDKEFQEVGKWTFEIADFLRKNNINADLIHPLDDAISLRAIAMQSNDCIILRSNMCMFKEAMNLGFFMIKTSIENLPYKKENDMLWVEDFCSTCGICIDRCPQNAYDENEKLIRKFCTAHREGCSKCMLICPFFKQGYEKVKKRYDRKQAR
ncbi:4Fe-4S binding protein [uncultured Methanobrevibacter sp.]|uniref:4Fe-4S binding protein n=1 Tax=uncultured Methanobrevibacter sp. TaxID=253161 RepID=UPI0025E3F98B|nr:4Fe-4S binding protein [uncultured Methanobrevibacter sp.]